MPLLSNEALHHWELRGEVDASRMLHDATSFDPNNLPAGLDPNVVL